MTHRIQHKIATYDSWSVFTPLINAVPKVRITDYSEYSDSKWVLHTISWRNIYKKTSIDIPKNKTHRETEIRNTLLTEKITIGS